MCKQVFPAKAASLAMVVCLSSAILAGQTRKPEIASGSEIKVRMIDALSSDTAKVGDIFHGTLDQPVMQNGQQLYPRGADVTGTVSAVHASGRLTDPGELRLVLNTLTSGRTVSSVSVEPLSITGESHTKSNATKIGGGAALGAVLGGVFGGGKGAAIGAGAGAAAGTGAAAATGKKDARVASEAILTFKATEAPAAAAASATPAVQPAAAAAPETEPAKDSGTSPDAQRSPASSTNSFDNAVLFTARDRRVIRNCLTAHAAELPSGIMEKSELPSGAERQVRVGGSLSTELQQKAQSLPLSCEEQLPKVPNDQERVIYSGRVLLLDGYGHILDMFDLQEND